MDDKDFYWLVGLLEGEGTFLKSPPSKKNCISIQLQMTDEDIIKKAAILFDVSYCLCKPKKKHHKVSFKFSVRGSKAEEWMKKLKPLMGERRQNQIENALSQYIPPRINKELPPLEVLKNMHKTLSLRQIAKEFDCSYQRIFNALKAA
jgi:hypothetical protein